MIKVVAGVVAAILLLPLVILFLLSSGSAISADPPPKVIGMETPVHIQVINPHGVRQVTASIQQNGQVYPVFQSASQPATRVFFFRKKATAADFIIPAGKNKASNLKDGKATLIVEAKANDFRAKTDRVEWDIDVNTQPPAVSADSNQHYINQGGCELVVFTVSGYWTESGVRVGKYTFRSFPMPGKPQTPGAPQQRFSLFAYPWDLGPSETPVVYARNPSGAEATANFWFKLFPKSFRTRDLDISDNFLSKVVNQIEPGSGDLLQRFLKINGEMRRANNKVLADLRLQTADHFLWKEPFQQLGNSKVESQFADQRTYIYNGKKVDQQVHLGFDLSVTQHVSVVSSNDGKIVYAAPLGIYGNCIVVDHGYGLQSIYAHLSQIGVKPGDMVKRGQELGRSGSTGLAGGDHLHFSMQVDGVQINPVEWWDAHWIHDRIFSKI